MTRSHHFSASAALLAALLVAVALPAFADHHEDGAAAHAKAAHEHGDAIEVVSTNVQGKNVFIPSTIVVEAGKPSALSLFNTTDTPHGFKIEAAGIEDVLMPGVEQRIELRALEPGIYKITCQLHPPHRGGRLVVIGF